MKVYLVFELLGRYNFKVHKIFFSEDDAVKFVVKNGSAKYFMDIMDVE